jgi:hypothetical protein
MINVKSIKTYFGTNAERVAAGLNAFLSGDEFVETDTEETYQHNGMAWVKISISGAYLEIANNLSDLNNASTARTNLGLIAGGSGDIWVEKAGDVMSGGLVINNSEGDNDFRIAGDGVTNGVFYDGGINTLGINTGSPNSAYKLHVVSTGANTLFERTSTGGAGINVFYNPDSTDGNAAVVSFATDTTGSGATAQKAGVQLWGITNTHNDSTYATEFQIRTRVAGAIGSRFSVTGNVNIDGTTTALVLSRLTTTQQNALTGVNGMIIYNTSTNKFRGYAGGAWVDLH